MTRLLVWTLTAAIALLSRLPLEAAQTSTAGNVRVSFQLKITDPVLHFYDVEMEIFGVRGPTVDVAMPAWSPGTYVIRDFARNVQQFESVSDRNTPLQFEKIDKQTWRISKAENEDLRVRYRVYSTTLNDEMADLLPAATFMYIVGRTQAPITVRYDIPGDWKVYTGLEERSGRYEADNYYTLADSPAFLGNFKVLDFRTNNVSHRVVFSNPRLQLTDMQVIADLEDLTAASAALFGLPYRSYTFLVRVQPLPGASSLGYLNSSRIVVGENDFVNQAGYTGFLIAATQSYVQTWIGKRIRPAFASEPERYDLAKESHTRLLWFTEGVSNYYAELLLLRARIAIPAEYYIRTSNEIRALQEQPGRRVMSLGDASWNVWTRSDNAADSAISHALKGKIAGLLLDMEIRGSTLGKRSLDDVIRHLLANHAEKGTGLTNETLAAAIQSATGVDARNFFEQVVRGRDELQYNRYLEKAGLNVTSVRAPSTIQFGIEFERIEGNQLRVRRVLPGSAAAIAKMDAGDILLAIDSERVTYDNITARIHSKRVGRPVALTILRGDRLMSLSLVPRDVQTESWSLGERPDATPDQSRIRNDWLGL